MTTTLTRKGQVTISKQIHDSRTHRQLDRFEVARGKADVKLRKKNFVKYRRQSGKKHNVLLISSSVPTPPCSVARC